MRALITFAGMDHSAEQRLRLAGRVLVAHQIEATVSAWDGARCDLLVACTSDAHGARAIAMAQERRTPILVFGDTQGFGALQAGRIIEQSSPVVLVVKSIVELLQASRTHVNSGGTAKELALVALAKDQINANSDVLIEIGAHRILFSRSSSRVSGESMRSIQTAMQTFGSADWRFVQTRDRPSLPFSVSSDSFLLDAAIQCSAQLPMIEDKLWKLSHWPDLGNSREQMLAMRVAMDLLRKATRPSALASKYNVPKEGISSYLWAFKAAGLLTAQDSMAVVPNISTNGQAAKGKRYPEGAFAKLVSRFGFS
jgi:hypothetical protein